MPSTVVAGIANLLASSALQALAARAGGGCVFGASGHGRVFPQGLLWVVVIIPYGISQSCVSIGSSASPVSALFECSGTGASYEYYYQSSDCSALDLVTRIQ